MSNCLLVLFLNKKVENTSSDATVDGHLYEVASRLPYDKLVLYPEEIDSADIFSDGRFSKEIQSGGDTGMRLSEAFRIGFERGYNRVVVVREGYPDLVQGYVIQAFEVLLETPVVIGPGETGSYYLIGMDRSSPQLFENKDWTGEDVFLDTILDLKKDQVPFVILDTLSCELLGKEQAGLSSSRL